MAVVWVREDWKNVGADWSGPLDNAPTRSFLIFVDDPAMTYQQVYLGAIASLPSRFDVFPAAGGFPLPTARKFSLRREPASRYYWRCNVSYSTEPLTHEEAQKEEQSSPLDRPPRINVDRENFELPIVQDRDDEAILNSAGDPYIDPVLWPATKKIYNVTFNSQIIPAWHDALEGMVNDDDVTISKGGTETTYPANTLLYLPGGISDLKEEAGIFYMEIGFQLIHNRKTWTLKLLDHGYQYLDGSTKKLIEVENDAGEMERVTDPQLLDGSGAILDDPSPSTAVFNDHDVAEEGDFSVLPLDDT